MNMTLKINGGNMNIKQPRMPERKWLKRCVSPVYVRERTLNLGQTLKQLPFVRPDTELCVQLRDDEKRSPASDFFWLENISKDVVSNVQDIASLGSQQSG